MTHTHTHTQTLFHLFETNHSLEQPLHVGGIYSLDRLVRDLADYYAKIMSQKKNFVVFAVVRF